MASVCFYFQVHQPYRLRPFTIFDTGHDYFDDIKNSEILRKVANKCYLPTNQLMLELIKKYNGRFRISYSITGTLLEQLEAYAPEVLLSFQHLAATGCVEFLAETYYHSLSFMFSPNEFVRQVNMHIKAMEMLFNQRPRIFRNTELIYNNELSEIIEEIGGFNAVLAEGADRVLGYKSSNYIYQPPKTKNIKLLLKNYRLSDDIAFRFSDRNWSEWPLKAEKFAQWINSVNGNGHVVNLFMDYETFGEHQWDHTGIFNFLRQLPEEILKHSDNNFKTLSEAALTYNSSDVIDIPYITSWADTERDISAWLGNSMQQNALNELFHLEEKVLQTNDVNIIEDWRNLQSSDHFYYMCTKYFADGDVHKYFNPYDSPYDSYINFMNVLDNLNTRCSLALQQKIKNLANT